MSEHRPQGWRGWRHHTRDERLAAIIGLRETGLGRNRIATALGTTRNMIAGYCNRYRAWLGTGPAAEPEAPRTALQRVGTVTGAAREMGVSRAWVRVVAERIQFQPDPAAVKRAIQENAAAMRLRALTKHGNRPRPNPNLTEAQQRCVDAMKGRGFQITTMKALPPPTKEEVARLVAEFEAKRGITKCPPAAPILQPFNAGIGFR